MLPVTIRNKIIHLSDPVVFDPSKHRTDGFRCGIPSYDKSFTGNLKKADSAEQGLAKLVIIDQKNSVKGLIIARPITKDDPSSDMEIYDLAVTERFQKQGLAEHLIRAALKLHMDSGHPFVRFVTAEVDPCISAHEDFYRRNGFEICLRGSQFNQLKKPAADYLFPPPSRQQLTVQTFANQGINPDFS